MKAPPEKPSGMAFHWCALTAGSIAQAEGRLEDSEYVRRLAYEMYEAVLRVRKASK